MEFNVDDRVLVKTAGKRVSKLQEKFRGPYKVLSKKNDIYELEEVDSKKKISRHVSALKQFIERCNAFLTLFLMIQHVSASIFDLSNPPLVWNPTEKIVFGKFVHYKVHYQLVDPCVGFWPMVLDNSVPSPLSTAVLNMDNKIKQIDDYSVDPIDSTVRTIFINCLDMFTKEVIKPLDSILNESEDARAIPFLRIEGKFPPECFLNCSNLKNFH